MIKGKDTLIEQIHNNIEKNDEQKEMREYNWLFEGLSEDEKEKRLQNLLESAKVFVDLWGKIVDTNKIRILDTFNKIAPLLDQIFQRIDALAFPAKILGKLQFVWWEFLPEDIMSSIANTETEEKKTEIIHNWVQGYNPEKAIEQLSNNKYLANWTIYQQSIFAYKHELYGVTALGLTACFDRILSLCSGKSTHTIEKRIKKLAQRFNELEYGKTKLTNADYNVMYLYETLISTVDQFNKRIPFTEREPQALNRHWLMHGRMKREITKLDCNKLINLLYGVILMKEMIDDDSE